MSRARTSVRGDPTPAAPLRSNDASGSRRLLEDQPSSSSPTAVGPQAALDPQAS